MGIVLIIIGAALVLLTDHLVGALVGVVLAVAGLAWSIGEPPDDTGPNLPPQFQG